MENNDINEDEPQRGGHKILPTNLLLKNDRKDIIQLLNKISKEYNVSLEDAAFSLSNVLKNITGI